LHYSELLEAQNADLARQTRTDPLTGLANRRGYGEVLGAALERAEQEGTPLSVAIVDLDHFKRVNDSLGHGEGDRVLVRVSQTLDEKMKGVGLAARYGGEEFALLLPGSDLEHAHEHCRMLCRALAAMQDCGGVTASIGVAQWRPGEEPGAALSRADAALYRQARWPQPGRTGLLSQSTSCRAASGAVAAGGARRRDSSGSRNTAPSTMATPR